MNVNLIAGSAALAGTTGFVGYCVGRTLNRGPDFGVTGGRSPGSVDRGEALRIGAGTVGAAAVGASATVGMAHMMSSSRPQTIGAAIAGASLLGGTMLGAMVESARRY